MGAECFRVSHVRPTYSGSHGFQGRWALGAAGASPCQRRGPRRSDNPASSSFPATGLRLVGPAGLLPQPCIRAELHVGSPAEGRGGGLRWPPIVRSVRLPPGRSLCALPSYSPSRPLCPLPPLFPTSCFLPSSGATEGCLEWGKWWGPPGGRRALPLPPPSLPTPKSLLKSLGSQVNLRGVQGGLLPQVSTVCQEESLPYLWDPGVPSGTSQSQPFLSVCCHFSTLFCSVLNPSQCQLFSPCLTVPPCSRGPATPKLSWCRPVVP